MKVSKRPFSPTYGRENGLFGINIDSINDLPFDIKEKSLVNIPPGVIGGNHHHPRWEAFVGMGRGLKLVWRDDRGNRQAELMNPEGKLYLFILPPHTPHAVINESNAVMGILLEYASESQHDVEAAKLIY